MRLYAGPSTHFIRDSAHNQIAEKLKSAFFQHYRFNPSPGEVNAWRNSLRATAQVLEEGGLKDHGILLEYQLEAQFRCCVYTAQGFEFDYVGVIWGPDLVYDFDRQGWLGRPERSHDKEVKRSKGAFTDLVKNAYRVLLSRGLKGCYVHFMDRETERFVRSRME